MRITIGIGIKLNANKVEATLAQAHTLLDQYKTAENLRKASLQHVLAQPGVASCIVGYRHINEVIENIDAVSD